MATTERSGDGAALEHLRTTVAAERGVVSVSQPQYNGARDTAMLTITPTDGPASPSTTKLVERLRDKPLAAAGIPVKLGGQTASFVDQASTTASRLPLFIRAVVFLAFLLLVAAFRAPVIALKAGVLTVLSKGSDAGRLAPTDIQRLRARRSPARPGS